MVKYFSSLCDYDTRYLHQLLVLNFYYFTKLAIAPEEPSVPEF